MTEKSILYQLKNSCKKYLHAIRNWLIGKCDKDLLSFS